jgi:hypothetical protein
LPLETSATQPTSAPAESQPATTQPRIITTTSDPSIKITPVPAPANPNP